MTLKQLREYILRKLGKPVINIEVTDDQINDAVQDAIDLFYEYHYDGLNKGYVFTSIIEGTQNYTLDDKIHEVLNVYSGDTFSGSEDRTIWQYNQSPFYMGYGAMHYDLVSTEVWRQNYQNYQNAFNKEVLFDFNSVSKKLYLHIEPEEDTTIALEVYKSELDLDDIYDDRWLKKYATATTKKQWGNNIGKFNNVSLPGGGQLNYADIMSQAETEIEKLEEELKDEYSEPMDFEVA